MVRTDGNLVTRLLISTSEYHRPGRLAAAVALGFLVGLVPKANLLALGLYAALLLLPVHTLLGVGVSLLVTCGVGLLEPMTDNIGTWLLSQVILRPLWLTLDSLPVVPWLCLHNSIVLGSFLTGLVLTAPTYLLSLRYFERLAIRTAPQPAFHAARPLNPNRSRTQRHDPLTALPAKLAVSSVAKTSALVIPPPKLALAKTLRMAPSHGVKTSDEEEIDFEPVREVTPIINSWHMTHAASMAHSLQAVGASNPQRSVASTTGLHNSRQFTSTDRMDSRDSVVPIDVGADRMEDVRLVPPPRPNGDQVDSLQLAHSASDVLAWADDLLDECLAAEGITLVSHNLEQPQPAKAADEQPTKFDVIPIASGSDDRWLMETTIEIVRWADETTPTQLHEAAPSQIGDTNLEQRETMLAQQPSNSWVAAGPSTVGKAADLEQTSPTTETPAGRRPVGFEQIVLASTPRSGPESESGATEPLRGECLGFLLGHLRQTREGKST